MVLNVTAAVLQRTQSIERAICVPTEFAIRKLTLTFDNAKPLQRGRSNPGALTLNLMLFGLSQLPPEATFTVTRPTLRA